MDVKVTGEGRKFLVLQVLTLRQVDWELGSRLASHLHFVMSKFENNVLLSPPLLRP